MPPLHPLFVHFGVASLMVTPVVFLVSLFWAPLRKRLGWLMPALAGLTALASALSSATGDLLRDQRGLAGDPMVARHETLASPLTPLAIIFFLLVFGWWMTTSPRGKELAERRAKWVLKYRTVITILAVLVAIAILILVVLAGDAGARAVWTR